MMRAGWMVSVTMKPSCCFLEHLFLILLRHSATTWMLALPARLRYLPTQKRRIRKGETDKETQGRYKEGSKSQKRVMLLLGLPSSSLSPSPLGSSPSYEETMMNSRSLFIACDWPTLALCFLLCGHPPWLVV